MGPTTVWSSTFFKISSFVFNRRKKLTQIWNDMSMSKCQHFLFLGKLSLLNKGRSRTNRSMKICSFTHPKSINQSINQSINLLENIQQCSSVKSQINHAGVTSTLDTVTITDWTNETVHQVYLCVRGGPMTERLSLRLRQTKPTSKN